MPLSHIEHFLVATDDIDRTANGIKIELNYDAAEVGDAKPEVMASDFARS